MCKLLARAASLVVALGVLTCLVVRAGAVGCASQPRVDPWLSTQATTAPVPTKPISSAAAATPPAPPNPVLYVGPDYMPATKAAPVFYPDRAPVRQAASPAQPQALPQQQATP
jgi:hypothetical protein